MYIYTEQKNKGFTIVEALVAVFILTISISAMLTLTASSITAARYANNEITGNYLSQEAVDSIRNSRDTIVFQEEVAAGGGWQSFIDRYGYTTNSKCFSSNGCYLKIDIFNPSDKGGTDIAECPGGSCPQLNYDSYAASTFYNYNNTGVPSNFSRKVTMQVSPLNPDEIEVTSVVSWLNGSSPKSNTLKIYLLNWQK